MPGATLLPDGAIQVGRRDQLGLNQHFAKALVVFGHGAPRR